MNCRSEVISEFRTNYRFVHSVTKYIDLSATFKYTSCLLDRRPRVTIPQHAYNYIATTGSPLIVLYSYV